MSFELKADRTRKNRSIPFEEKDELMKKILSVLVIALYSTQTIGGVNCVGTPKAVYAGDHGPFPAEQSFWVTFKEGGHYFIGQVSDELASARYSLLLAALMAEKQVTLRFYTKSTCEEAIQQKAVPTSLAVSN